MLAKALTIAGSDSGGGAGIQADLKTFLAYGVHGTSAVTALTAQNSIGVFGVHEIPPEFVREQIEAVVSDIGCDATKTGMLASATIVEAVARAVEDFGIRNLVCDPVFVSKHGDALLREDAVDALRRRLIPLATVLTPNLPEAEGLLGRPIRDADAEDAARDLASLGCAWVLLKGGHRGTDDAVDILTDGNRVVTLEAPRIPTKHTHGTGCTLAAAIAAGLALGRDVPDAVRDAKSFVWKAIERHLELGRGIGAVNPAHAIWR